VSSARDDAPPIASCRPAPDSSIPKKTQDISRGQLLGDQIAEPYDRLSQIQGITLEISP